MLPFYGRKLPRRIKKTEVEKLQNSNFFFSKRNISKLAIKISEKPSEVNLEIGFGDGKNIISQAQVLKDELFIACDPYLKGSLFIRKNIERLKIKNLALTDLPFLELTKYLKNVYFKKIFILFPDPWPKKKHKKRRLINDNFIKIISKFTKKKSRILVSTDNRDYLNQILYTFHKTKEFNLNNKYFNDSLIIKYNIPKTTYLRKAMESGEKSYFLVFDKEI
tara:strand:- start:82 stop:744 length:663 start_codon:yes stop_codon:yes gene_type:complete